MDALEIQTLKLLDKVSAKKLILAVSGGMDSMVLMEVFSRLQKRRQLELIVAHVHHGGRSRFRNMSALFVENEARRRGLSCVVLKSTSGAAFSEEALRKLRYEKLENLRLERGYDLLVLAHHKGDLFETRLMRLVRGVGPQGLRAMKTCVGHKFRPFLYCERSVLLQYAQSRILVWKEDPSNTETQFFRNWIRSVWLPMLESRQPGALKSFARSLNTLSQMSKSASKLSQPVFTNGIERQSLLELEKPDQMRVLALYMKQSGLKDYRRGQIEEILKRLDTPKSEFTFKCVGREWRVDAKHLIVES